MSFHNKEHTYMNNEHTYSDSEWFDGWLKIARQDLTRDNRKPDGEWICEIVDGKIIWTFKPLH